MQIQALSLPVIQSTVSKLEMDLGIVLDMLQTEMTEISTRLDSLNEDFFRNIVKTSFREELEAKENEYKDYFDANFKKIEEQIRAINQGQPPRIEEPSII